MTQTILNKKTKLSNKQEVLAGIINTETLEK